MNAININHLDSPQYHQRIKGGVALSVARSLCLMLSLFIVLNNLAAWMTPSYQPNLWWIDLRALTWPIAWGLTWMFALSLLGFAIEPRMNQLRHRITLGLIGLMITAALINTSTYFDLVQNHRIDSPYPVPLSLLIVVLLAWLMRQMIRSNHNNRPTSRLHRFPAAVTLLICLVSFPLAQMYGFGYTDYRRPASAAVVFGARAYADGRCSDALADRVGTACELYHEGLVAYLIFSGGPGDGDIHETVAMQRLANQLGVPDSAIIRDEAGLNTQSTVANTSDLFQQMNINRVIAVSHFYHLPRIKMTYQRAGFDVYTVPAKEQYTLRQLPYNLAREVAAFWVYYKRTLIG